MTQKSHLPSIFTWIYVLYAGWQQLCCSQNGQLMKCSINDIGMSRIYQFYITVSGLFICGTSSTPLVHIIFIFLAVCVVFSVLTYLTTAAIFYRTRTYNKWVLMLHRVSIEFIVPLITLPLGQYIGALAYFAVNNFHQVLQMVYLVLSCIFYFYCIFVLYITFTLFYSSPFLATQDFIPWGPSYIYQYYVVQSIFQFCGGFLAIFPDWISPVLCVLHILYDISLIVKLSYGQYISIKYNNTLMAIAVGSIAGEILTMVNSLSNELILDYAIVGGVTIIVFILSLFIIHPLMKRKIRRIEEFLARDPICDEDFFFENILRSKKRALLYMHVGVEKMSPHLLDWSLIKFLVNGCDDNDVILEAIRVVSWFPGETRLQNMIFRQALQKRNLQFPHRFVLYQADRIRSVRLSSASVDVTETLSKLTRATNSCIDEICGFWKELPKDPGVITGLSHMLSEIKFKWLEAVYTYPNSYLFRDEYAKFLIDCESDYVGGIKQKYISGLLDQGYSFSVDLSFRSFINNFPLYLKRKIVDMKGNLVKVHKGGKSTKSSSNSSGGQFSTLSTISEIDHEIQDKIGRSMFRNSKMRLSMQGALESRPNTNLKRIEVFAIFSFLVQIAAALLAFFMMYNIYDGRINAIRRLFSYNTVRAMVTTMDIELLNLWGVQRNIINNDVTKYINDMSKGENLNNFYNIAAIPGTIVGVGRQSIVSFKKVLTQISNMAANGENVETTASQFVKGKETLSFCFYNESTYILEKLPRDSKASLQSLFVEMYFSSMHLNQERTGNYTQDTEFCQILTNIENFKTSSDNLAMGFIKEEDDYTEKYSTFHLAYEIAIPVVGFVLTYGPSFFFSIMFHFELKNVLAIMKETDPVAIDQAAHPIIKTDDDEVLHPVTTVHSRRNLFLGAGLGTMVYLIFSILVFVNIYISQTYLKKFSDMHTFMYLSSLRKPMALESLFATLCAVLSMKTTNFDVTKWNKVTSLRIQATNAKLQMDRAIINNNFLISGAGDVPPCIGFSKELDNINLKEQCQDSETIHDVIKCSSLQQNLENCISLLSSFMATLTRGNYSFVVLNDTTYYNFAHIIINHLTDLFNKADTIIFNLAGELIDTYRSSMVTFLGIELGYSVLAYIVGRWITFNFQSTYKALITLILRLPPIYVVNNEKMLNYVLNREASKSSDDMDTARSIIHNSSDAILCLSKNEIIEIVNASVQTLLGYTPEQLLGQPLSLILAEESQAEISQQTTMMKTGQCALQFECHSHCISDDDTTIACHTTVIGMGDHSASSFVILFRNEEELLKQQKEAEQAKNQSEVLLYQILPRDIVNRLNQGEKNISFSVPSASIIFIDIQRFSEYAASLTPAQIMGNLSLIFDSFDKSLAKYSEIIKIKLIGDVYMAAAGLFHPESPPTLHAEQTVRFGLDALSELEEINMKLTSSLQIRIGVNSGGPLIAGVLGTDKPVFDIIGDPINIAARLQSTDIPGRIQISPNTFELVSNLDFIIEKRGEIFLKGKGKTVSYLVSPANQSTLGDPSYSFLISSNTSIKDAIKSYEDSSANTLPKIKD